MRDRAQGLMDRGGKERTGGQSQKRGNSVRRKGEKKEQRKESTLLPSSNGFGASGRGLEARRTLWRGRGKIDGLDALEERVLSWCPKGIKWGGREGGQGGPAERRRKCGSTDKERGLGKVRGTRRYYQVQLLRETKLGRE